MWLAASNFTDLENMNYFTSSIPHLIDPSSIDSKKKENYKFLL